MLWYHVPLHPTSLFSFYSPTLTNLFRSLQNKQQKFASGLSYPSDASSFPSKVVPVGCLHFRKDIFPTAGLILHPQANLCVCVCTQLLICVQLFATPWTVAGQAPLSMEFFRQEYWSGLPCPPPGDFPDSGIEPMSLMSPVLAGRFFTTSTTWEAPESS